MSPLGLNILPGTDLLNQRAQASKAKLENKDIAFPFTLQNLEKASGVVNKMISHVHAR